MTDRNNDHDIVGSLYDTEYFGEHFESSSFGGPSPRSDDRGKRLAIRIIVILIAIIAFAIYAHAETEREKREYREMWSDLYKGYSQKDWQRSKYYRGSKSTTVTTPSSNSNTTRKKSTTPYKKKTSESSDSLNVKDYRDPEDFYYDNYDDFLDYEEAEDYYYDHGGY